MHYKKRTRLKKGTRINNGRALINVRFSQNVCVIKEEVVPINELVTKDVRIALNFWVYNNRKLL